MCEIYICYSSIHQMSSLGCMFPLKRLTICVVKAFSKTHVPALPPSLLKFCIICICHWLLLVSPYFALTQGHNNQYKTKASFSNIKRPLTSFLLRYALFFFARYHCHMHEWLPMKLFSVIIQNGQYNILSEFSLEGVQ